MKIVCNRQQLVEAVSNVQRAVSTKSSVPALEGILLKAGGDELTLCGFDLELGMTTVGTSLQLAHTAPTPIGMVVQCDCEVLEVTDRRVRFGFRVYDDVTEVAGGEHERYLVDAERWFRKARVNLIVLF